MSSNSKALVAQLQGVLAQLDFASEEMRAEMREQISPDPVALEKLRGAQAAKVNALDGKAADKAAAQEALSVQLEANVAARHVAVAQRADVEAAVADLRDQVAGVRSGAKLEAAMNTLKTSIREEKEALASQLAEMQARREKATASLGELAARGAALAAGGPECGSPTGAGAAGAAACAACAAIFASNSSCCFPASSWSLIASFTACGTSSSSIGSMTVQGSEFAGRPKGERSFPTCFALLRAQALSFFGWWRRYGIASAQRAKGALEQWRDGRGDERPG